MIETKAGEKSPEVLLDHGRGFWDLKLAPFLQRHFAVLCLCLIAIACFRIVITYSALSLTSDEPIHFACGLQYIARHVYIFEPQHPPLSRGLQALGPYLAGARPLYPYLQPWYHLPTIRSADDFVASPGWTAVSPTYDKSTRFSRHGSDATPFWYDRANPGERAGVYLLYYTAPSTPNGSGPAVNSGRPDPQASIGHR